MADLTADPRRASPGGPSGPGASRGLFAESSRVEAFSDGVFAIVITLLVLDLKAPAHHGTVLRDLLAQWPAYVAYLASFAYVGVIWVNHHQMFTRIARVNAGLLWRNLALLLTTSVLPFPTAVVGSAFQLGDRADESAALAFYAAVGATTAATWLLLFHFLSRAPRLLEDEAHTAFFARERHRAVAGVAVYAVSGLYAIWHPVAGLAIACVLPLFYGVTSAGLRSPRPEGP
ncbi:MAG TPA: TMEM175 family protein [Streptosporangiaceae bacterium]|nr:TMEM175 family protein [Streptosporangiaceae bacterium]